MNRRSLALLILAMPAMAADLSGTWTGSIPARNNEIQDLTFQLFQKGETLSGKMYRDTTAVPILDGKVVGDQISFRVESEEQIGNEFILIRYKFTGSIRDAGIELTREREANPLLKPGNPNTRVSQRPTFALKRLF